MSLVVFPFKDEDPDVVAANLATAASHDRVREVWAVAAVEGTAMDGVGSAAAEIGQATAKPVSVFPQERLGDRRSGKGDGMNTAMTLAAERGFDRVHFYDADITNFDAGWIDGAEKGADLGYGVVRHRFPRAATDAMITWMVTRPGLALLFPGTVLPRLGQPLGGELLVSGEVVATLAADSFVRARSDWGIDTVITHATAIAGAGIYEHHVADGKRHALYGSLTDIRDMVLECLDAVGSLRHRPAPPPDAPFHAEPPAPVPGDLKKTVAYDVASTRAAISGLPDAGERAVLGSLGIDLESPTVIDGETWLDLFPRLMEGFRLDERAWRSAAFRLWVERVIHYTTNQVTSGFDRAMEYLEGTVAAFERSDGRHD